MLIFFTMAIISFHVILMILHHIKKLIFTSPVATARTNQCFNIVSSHRNISYPTVLINPFFLTRFICFQYKTA